MQRIVMAIADIGIDGRMESRNEPMLGPRTGDDVKQRQAVILRGSKGGIGRLRVVAPTASGGGAAAPVRRGGRAPSRRRRNSPLARTSSRARELRNRDPATSLRSD